MGEGAHADASVRLEMLSDNNRAVISVVEVSEDQRTFINDGEPISGFIANAPLHPTFAVYGIYADDQLVGLISYGHEDHDPVRWWILLSAIDRRFQKRGYCRGALLIVIERMRQDGPECREVGLSYLPDNTAAECMYRSLGFEKSPQLNKKGSVESWLQLRTGATRGQAVQPRWGRW